MPTSCPFRLITKIFSVEPDYEKDFSDYELGLQKIGFGDTVEVVEAYLQDYEITSLQDAIEEVTKDQEKTGSGFP